ncbi:hypothetical protein DL240_08900 [Lujinxingia litoralis]|uniref:Phytoene synthase n=1 Tax=Lujinxingia litoralis TaxID=2211119 RepID=A0A328C839_9DELT|nr:phytoene/squalene synthase family protein [Lujinxingia litoralis]RAL22998.1 hypothetical protein DL240_08900 [Lujinxingia litoralis]
MSSPAEPRSSTELVRVHEQILARGSRSFRLASYFLPSDRRGDAAHLYALCRLIDDTADEAATPQQARRGLDELRRELRGEHAPRPLITSFLEMARRRDLDLAYVFELIEGVESDLGEVCVASDAELLRYAYRVAGTVGVMMCAVLGVTDPRAIAHAIDLGVGMQLTNICRDVLEDARMGRVYLPARRLQARGLHPAHLLEERADTAALASVVTELLDLAEHYYRSAERGMVYIPARSRAAIMVASRVYRAIGLKLRARGANPLRGRTIVSPAGRILRAAGGCLAWLSTLGQRPARAPSHNPDLHRELRGLPGIHA